MPGYVRDVALTLDKELPVPRLSLPEIEEGIGDNPILPTVEGVLEAN